MSGKPTIHELEKILEETDPGQVRINPDGSVVVGPSYDELKDRIAALETQIAAVLTWRKSYAALLQAELPEPLDELDAALTAESKP